MSTIDRLNAGVFTYGRKLGDGLTWWLDELRALARSTFPASSRWARGLIAEGEEDGVYRLTRAGRPDRKHSPKDRPVKAALMLPPGVALTRLLWRPPLPERDLRRMTELDLDRLTPFRPESVYAVIDILAQADETGRRQVRVAVAPRAQTDELLARALRDGIRPTALLVSDGVGLIDFLPKMGRRRSLAASRLALAGWTLVSALLALNLGVAIWRDVQATDALQDRVAVEAPRMAHIAAARNQLARLRAQSAAQAAARIKDDPLRVLAGLSRALPADATVDRLAWDGASVRVVGEARNGVDVAAALRRDPLFTEVHPSDGEGAAAGPQFDLTLTVAAAPGSGKR
jgi:general secretion pathway protein L